MLFSVLSKLLTALRDSHFERTRHRVPKQIFVILDVNGFEVVENPVWSFNLDDGAIIEAHVQWKLKAAAHNF